MPKISDYNLYDIDDLIATWKKGWQQLAKLGYSQYPHKLKESGDKSKPLSERILLALKDMLNPFVGIGEYFNVPKSCPDHIEILNLAASSNKNPYSPVVEKYYTGGTIIVGFMKTKGLPRESVGGKLGTWSQNKTKLKKALQKTTNAFATNKNFAEAFSKIATKDNMKRFTDFWYQQDCRWSKGEYLGHKIEPRLKKMMEWLEYGLKSENSCEEAWWNCLWLFVEPIVETMLEIKKRINDKMPLYQEQLRTLNYYIAHGYPSTHFLMEHDGKYKIQILLKPHTPKMIANSPFEVMSVILLVQPAFALTQQLQDSFSKPRFLRQCRAPSCQQFFYTGRANATACPGSQGNKKNECALQWVRYKRFLQKIGKNPEKHWDNQQLKKQFIVYDQS